MVYQYDDVAMFCLEPSSVILDCLFPIEYIFAEWAYHKANCFAYKCIGNSDTDIYTGSETEGFAVPRLYVYKDNVDLNNRHTSNAYYWMTDIDMMSVKDIYVQTDKHQAISIATITNSLNDQRYVKLKLTDEWKRNNPVYKNLQYLSHDYCLEKQTDWVKNTYQEAEIHGPVQKIQGTIQVSPGFRQVVFEEDLCKVLKYPATWPENAMIWLVRPRLYSWPSAMLLQDILEAGCHLAPVGRGMRMREPIDIHDGLKHLDFKQSGQHGEDSVEMDINEWRISFSVAENKLAQSVSPIQRYVFILLKMIKKCYLSDFVCTYHLKNLLFWECEEKGESFWKGNSVVFCIAKMLERLQVCLSEGNLPHYIIPDSNLLASEDPEKLKKAADIVANIRENILSKLTNLLQRVSSHAYESAIYHKDFNLEHFSAMVNKCPSTSNTNDIKELLIMLHEQIIDQSIAMIKEAKKSLQIAATEAKPKQFSIPLFLYQSVLARNVTKLYFVNNERKECDVEVFTNFVKKYDDDTLCLDERFLNLAIELYELMGKAWIPLFSCPTL